MLEAKQAVWELLGSNLSVGDAEESAERVINSATEENFRQFIFPKLLSAAEGEIQKSIHSAIEIASGNNSARIMNFISSLYFNRIGQRVYVSSAEFEEVRYALDALADVAKEYRSIDSFLAGMNKLDRSLRKSASTKRLLRLSTIEDVKGLEFRAVFIPDCNKNTFDNGSQDERNLFYVAASRAKELLVNSHSSGHESTHLRHFAP